MGASTEILNRADEPVYVYAAVGAIEARVVRNSITRVAPTSRRGHRGMSASLRFRDHHES